MKSLTVRLLLFNVLLLFLPMGSLLYLDTYESQLLNSQENSMIQQGRILSSALAGLPSAEGGGAAAVSTALAEAAARILENLRGRVDSRIRIVDTAGNLLADSATVQYGSPDGAGAGEQDSFPAENRGRAGAAGNADGASSPNRSILYRIAVDPVNLVKRFLFPPQANFSGGEFYSGKQVLLGPEVLAALEGRYGAATRYSSGGQVSVNLYSAIPIPGIGPGEITGAVLVSRSTYGILFNLYRLRLDIIRIFFISLLVSLFLSLGLSFTITVPVRKLKNEAETVLDNRGRFTGHFRGLKRMDEIGDLSRSLSKLSQKLERRIGHIDAFTSDLLHELKNPLAAIRGQTELALASPVKEERLLRGIMQEEGRMERFLARLRELSRIDNTLEREEAEVVDLRVFLPLFLETWSQGAGGRTARPAVSGGPESGPIFDPPPGTERALVRINPDRLVQAITNPLENACSFSPPGGTIRLGLQKDGGAGGPQKTGGTAAVPYWIITIDDEGPGIRDGGDRYFERFYSERPPEDRDAHSGLGLAIVKAIAEGYGGRCSLANRGTAGGVQGCRFTLFLPAAG
ncbi:MAG: histidine kinase [Treponema sp.]|jgi:two-component system sensor histidine kinase ChvG|nr:histidine kinase [Treponema sp.]